ncbi:hypothetical protein M3583_22285, partial [Bacillus subtilis]|nr:hypothetical protein [Bacillus subtilis]
AIVFRIDGAGVDVLAITVNAHNNQKTDQAVYLYAMANVRSNAHQRWFNRQCSIDGDPVAGNARELTCQTR